MNVTLIRNATLTLDFAGQKFLIDPMLAKKAHIRGLRVRLIRIYEIH